MSNLPAFLQPRSVRGNTTQPAATKPSYDDDSDGDDVAANGGGGLDFTSDSNAKTPTNTQSQSAKATSPGYRPVTDSASAKPVHVRHHDDNSNAQFVRPQKVSTATSTGLGGYDSPTTPITLHSVATNTIGQTSSHDKKDSSSPMIDNKGGYEEDDDPLDFDEDLLAEDDPNEDDEAYRMRMADELAPICEGMSHEEIVELLDDYAKQRKIRRAAYLQKKATAAKNDRTKRLLAKRRITPPPTDVDEPVEVSSQEAMSEQTQNDLAVEAAAPMGSTKESLGHLMFGAIDAQMFGSQPSPSTLQKSLEVAHPKPVKNTPTTKEPFANNSAIDPPIVSTGAKEIIKSGIPATKDEIDQEQYYAPRQAEARMAQQLQSLLGEFEESKKAAHAERVESESISRSGATSRLSEGSGGGGGGRAGILKKSTTGATSKKVGTVKVSASIGNEEDNEDDDDLLCVTGAVPELSRGIPSSFASLIAASSKPTAMNPDSTGALSSEGPTSAAGDKDFRTKAKAMCSVRRHAPEHNTSPTDSPTKHSAIANGVRAGGTPKTPAVATVKQRALLGTSSSSSAIPMPPTNALEMPPAPKLQSELGKAAVVANRASLSNAPKPSVPRRSSSQSSGITPASSGSTMTSSVGAVTGGAQAKTNQARTTGVVLPRKTPTPPPQALSVGGFTFLKK